MHVFIRYIVLGVMHTLHKVLCSIVCQPFRPMAEVWHSILTGLIETYEYICTDAPLTSYHTVGLLAKEHPLFRQRSMLLRF